MVSRVYCECNTCKKITMIKCQVGYAGFPVVFTCPNCLTEIRGYCENIDEEARVKISFDNATMIEKVEKPSYYIAVSRELLTSHIKEYEDSDDYALSPFMRWSNEVYSLNNNSLSKKAVHFADKSQEERIRVFDYIKLWQNEKFEILGDSLRDEICKRKLPFEDVFEENSKLEVYMALHNFFNYSIIDLIPNNWLKSEDIFGKVRELNINRTMELVAYLKEYEGNNVFKNVEKKIYKSLEHFVKLIDGILPAYFALDFIKDEEQYSNYCISTVSFDYLLDFYHKSYQTILEASDILIALNNICHRGNYKTMLDGKDFSSISSGKFLNIKNYLSNNEMFSSMIKEMLHNRIRNSIGHFSTEFDSLSQEITFIDKNNNATHIEKMSLIEFAIVCIENFYTLFYIAEVVYQIRKVIFIIESDKAPSFIRKMGIGRNQLCPCGSGKKYKKCCGN